MMAEPMALIAPDPNSGATFLRVVSRTGEELRAKMLTPDAEVLRDVILGLTTTDAEWVAFPEVRGEKFVRLSEVAVCELVALPNQVRLCPARLVMPPSG